MNQQALKKVQSLDYAAGGLQGALTSGAGSAGGPRHRNPRVMHSVSIVVELASKESEGLAGEEAAEAEAEVEVEAEREPPEESSSEAEPEADAGGRQGDDEEEEEALDSELARKVLLVDEADKMALLARAHSCEPGAAPPSPFAARPSPDPLGESARFGKRASLAAGSSSATCYVGSGSELAERGPLARLGMRRNTHHHSLHWQQELCGLDVAARPSAPSPPIDHHQRGAFAQMEASASSLSNLSRELESSKLKFQGEETLTSLLGITSSTSGSIAASVGVRAASSPRRRHFSSTDYTPFASQLPVKANKSFAPATKLDKFPHQLPAVIGGQQQANKQQQQQTPTRLQHRRQSLQISLLTGDYHSLTSASKSLTEEELRGEREFNEQVRQAKSPELFAQHFSALHLRHRPLVVSPSLAAGQQQEPSARPEALQRSAGSSREPSPVASIVRQAGARAQPAHRRVSFGSIVPILAGASRLERHRNYPGAEVGGDSPEARGQQQARAGGLLLRESQKRHSLAGANLSPLAAEWRGPPEQRHSPASLEAGMRREQLATASKLISGTQAPNVAHKTSNPSNMNSAAELAELAAGEAGNKQSPPALSAAERAEEEASSSATKATQMNVSKQQQSGQERAKEKDLSIQSIMANARLRQEEFARLLEEHEQIVNEINRVETKISSTSQTSSSDLQEKQKQKAQISGEDKQ